MAATSNTTCGGVVRLDGDNAPYAVWVASLFNTNSK